MSYLTRNALLHKAPGSGVALEPLHYSLSSRTDTLTRCGLYLLGGVPFFWFICFFSFISSPLGFHISVHMIMSSRILY